MYGFRPVRGRFGFLNPTPIKCTVATAYQAAADPGAVSVDLNIYDPVKKVNDGTVALCLPGEAVYGIIIGVEPYWDGTRMIHGSKLPGATAWGTIEDRKSQVLVIPATDCDWEVDVDDIVTATTEAGYRALIGENCDHIFAPNATLRKAFPKLDIDTHDPASRQWRIKEISGRHNADFAEDNVKLIVEVNETIEAPFVTAGV